MIFFAYHDHNGHSYDYDRCDNGDPKYVYTVFGLIVAVTRYSVSLLMDEVGQLVIGSIGARRRNGMEQKRVLGLAV